MSNSGWIGVDFDGTLATYDGWKGIDHVGEPIETMCDRVRRWLRQGKNVKIFTARVHGIGTKLLNGQTVTERDVKKPMEEFCVREFGQVLEITNVKDFGMIELWDDRAIQVEFNTGKVIE